ncbi:DNA-3-methyladenine glycosylase 2 family protein [Candidatus Daviesbacteria bacterium]|nr:DNA-3-methyladenine glycosylase 2 family protein [Candidatus Daviesbacteria bacterium]
MDPKIRKHFKKVDRTLYSVIKKLDKLEPLKIRDESGYFLDLVDSIISQQLSVKVSNTILARFKKLFKREIIDPKDLLKLSDDQIRTTGTSFPKIKYLKDLAEKLISKELDLSKLKVLDDEQVIEQLTKVKGIGKWTAEMFLMFSLGREDIFSYGDLGLKNALKKLYKLENPTKEQIEKIVAKWSPYKTHAARVLWKSLNNLQKMRYIGYTLKVEFLPKEVTLTDAQKTQNIPDVFLPGQRSGKTQTQLAPDQTKSSEGN